MSLLDDIQRDATDGSVDITTALRRAKILAAHLGNEQFTNWVERELCGYGNNDELPSYRMARVESEGSFFLPGGYRGVLGIPASVLPEKLRGWANQARFRGPIAEYVSLASSKSEQFQVSWPVELAQAFGRKAYLDSTCFSAWQVICPAHLICIVDSVRTRLLGFALAIQKENPEAGEVYVKNGPAEQERIKQVFNTVIYGGNNNLATGTSPVAKQQLEVCISREFETLQKALESAGAKPEEISELQSDLDTAVTNEQKESAVDSWLGRTARKAAAATRAFAVEVSAKALAEYLKPPGP